MGSAETARERIAYTCWLERVNMLLALGGYRESDFGTVNFRLLYEAGMKPLTVAEQLLDNTVTA